jgi:hypothetical protein
MCIIQVDRCANTYMECSYVIASGHQLMVIGGAGINNVAKVSLAAGHHVRPCSSVKPVYSITPMQTPHTPPS